MTASTPSGPAPGRPPGRPPALPIDQALLDIVRCPVTGERLERVGDELRTASGRVYHIVDGLPVLVPAGRDSGAQEDGTDSTGTC